MTESSPGQLLFELAHPRADGTTHLLLDPLELIEKIALLIPPPRFHTLRFHGVFAAVVAGYQAMGRLGRVVIDRENARAAPGLLLNEGKGLAGSPPF